MFYKTKKYFKKSYKIIKSFFYFIKNIKIYFFILIKMYHNFFSGKKIIVLHCYQPSHYQNIPTLYSLLLKKQFAVYVFCNFSKKNYNIEIDSKNVLYDFGPELLPILPCHIYITPGILAGNNFPSFSKIIHFLVSLTSLDGVYPSNAFDCYDYIFCAGPHQIEDFKRWKDENQKLNNKILIKGGYPKLDYQMKKLREFDDHDNNKTIVYAPTHVYDVNKELASLSKYGEKIIDNLIQNNYNVIFRPHPVSFKDADADLIKNIVKKYSQNLKFKLDESKDYFETYSKTSIMITDLSGTGFTYSFTFERPTIFFAYNEKEEKNYKGIQFENREDIGAVARNTDELIQKINLIFSDYELYKKKVINFRKKIVYNIGNSEKYFVENIDFILNNKKNSDWEYL